MHSNVASSPRLCQLSGRAPKAVAVADPRQSLTWAELDEQTTAFGHGLERLGLAPGDHVALVARNSVNFVVVVLGAQRAGMIVTPVKTGWTADEVEYLVTDADSRVVANDVDSSRAVGHLAAGAGSTVMVPTMFRQLLALPERERARLPVPTLRSVVHGGEPCPLHLKQQMIQWLGPVFIEYFGVSEGGMTLASTEE